MKIFMTGGGGYIGSSLLRSLSEENEIVCIDHGRHYGTLRSLLGKNVKLIEGDIMDRSLVGKNMKGADLVLHLAGGGGNDACMKDPAKAVMANICGTHVLLKAAEANHVDRLVFASSYIAYSTFLKREMPLTEDMELRPDDFYGGLKAASEYEIKDSGIDYVILRLSNVYGYGLGLGHEWGGVVGRFIKSGFETSTIPVYGTGKQRIDVVHIGDVCRAISMIIDNKQSRNECFNIGSGEGTSVEDIATAVQDAFKNKFRKNVRIEKKPAPPGKIWPDRWVSVSKIGRQLGWKPEVRLEAGISDLAMKYKG